jgi:small conductance mechanosensitive channel
MDPMELTAQASTFVTQLSALAAIALPRFVSAILLLLIGWWLANWADRTLRKLIDGRIDPTLTSVVASGARYGILVLIGVAVLGQMGIQTTSVLAALGAIGLAVGLAMQGTLANVAAGMMLLWLRPFKVGDFIDTGAFAGAVKEVGLFATELTSWDGIYQFVPNSQLWNVRLINYSRLPTRLVEVQFGVSYSDDLTKGQQTLLDLALADGRVLRHPAEPIVFVSALGDSAVTISLRCWGATSDYWPLRRQLTERGKLALEAAGLSIPFPQRDVHLYPVPSDQPEEAKAA